MTRRKQIFSLSIPGGRPLNWLWISEECLTLMNDLQQRLYFYVNHYNMTISKDQKTVLETPSRHYQEVTPASVETFFSNSVKSRVKNISSLQSDSTHNSSTQKHLEDLKHKKKVTTMERIKNIPFMKYLIKPMNEYEMEEIFFDVQLQIWTAEGISRLVAASYSEDVFGVVQSTLPFILTSLLELLQMVEIYLKKLTNEELLSHQRPQPNEMRKSVNVLRDTLRSSIYRITKTFQNHISDVELSTKNREFLINFLKFLA
ncbi:nucleoporin NDC1-like [Xenia sp. Carnegie-2017]|uniref:nucleoporin NDC1-like n=1 Tax=Xenia sp. Carnegie-2017 TaxID=2897299 RepID=UPI001F03FE6B|nr:nucleoporin NDC1-like [Xenia sp. Carnegie-2017]